MSVFKCKMCGGTIEFEPGATVGVCDSCGTKQTLPRLDDDKKANLYDRANHFRRNNDYDKAASFYEQILNEDATDAEAYWSLVLCRYGIEYVEDPQTHRRVPTVNRTQYTSIFADEDYKSALQYADGYQKEIYEAEAKEIDEIQKGILAISQKEEPFDVFICYKETDSNGRRTRDSVLANDLYHELTQEGFKVFYSRITLEDKLGSAYEPYIFAALNSAKVMVVLGTRSEYFNAVWVKNEWSRYLALIKNGAKKMLIPAYRDMDPYDLPEEFSYLQAQDMSKLGFMQDLIRGIKKIAQDEPKAAAVKETVVVGGAGTEPLLKRVFLFLEDGDWSSADEYCEKVLDIDPENVWGYLGKLMAKFRVRKWENLKECPEPFDGDGNYQKVLRFADEKLKAELAGYIEQINTRNENARLEGIYTRAKTAMDAAATESACKEAAQAFKSVSGYKDADALAEACLEKAAQTFASVSGYKDADALAAACLEKIEHINNAREKYIKETFLKPAEAGITVFFGAYEQDNDTSNGKEPIEWLVLAKENGRMLLLSKYALDCRPYNESRERVTWETCSLREWLNHDFFNAAFSAREKSVIPAVTVPAHKNPKYDTGTGANTKDKVFLLSITEAEKYFAKRKRRCYPTVYAKAQGVSTWRWHRECWWWLRSPGESRDEAAEVIENGEVFYRGSYVDDHFDAVRPALWINLK